MTKMDRYYYSFWIRLLDFYPLNRIAWELVARSYKYVHSWPRLYRPWDKLFSDVFYLHCARVKSFARTSKEAEATCQAEALRRGGRGGER